MFGISKLSERGGGSSLGIGYLRACCCPPPGDVLAVGAVTSLVGARVGEGAARVRRLALRAAAPAGAKERAEKTWPLIQVYPSPTLLTRVVRVAGLGCPGG
jgi:hypothetical protein